MKKGIIELLIIAVSFLVAGFILGFMVSDAPPAQEFGIISTTEVMSAYEAEMFLDSVIAPHQYYLINKDKQTATTGDDEWQRYRIKQYGRLKELVKQKGR